MRGEGSTVISAFASRPTISAVITAEPGLRPWT